MIERSVPFMLKPNSWGVIWSRDVEDTLYLATVELTDDHVQNTRKEWRALVNLEGR